MSSDNQRYALISVSDKTGLVDFVQTLRQYGFRFISTSGSAELLRQANIIVEEISDITNYPEILGGRVRTLHPAIHGGILHRRDHDDDIEHVIQHNLLCIDMVIINLYPFVNVLNHGGNLEQAIENIDIGGSALLRAAAKNYQHVIIISEHHDYQMITKALKENDGKIPEEIRLYLAHKAFALSSWYDSHIANYLFLQTTHKDTFPQQFNQSASKNYDLRYGENAHQRAALYQISERKGIAHATQLQGGQMSYNNFIDADCALSLISEFENPACCIVKHANPCGVAEAISIDQSWQRALNCDPKSAFGGIVGFNRSINVDLAKQLSQLFLEVIVAPSLSEEALKILAKKPKLRILTIKPIPRHNPFPVIQSISGGYLVQDEDFGAINPEEMEIVSKRKASEQEMTDLMFSWRVAKYVKSNAIVLGRDRTSVGIGAGQMSRVDATNIAVNKAGHFQGANESVAASDAFIPFIDTINLLADAGITAIIQPGGSVRDAEIIATANQANMAMVFTRVRHFRH